MPYSFLKARALVSITDLEQVSEPFILCGNLFKKAVRLFSILIKLLLRIVEDVHLSFDCLPQFLVLDFELKVFNRKRLQFTCNEVFLLEH